MTVADPRPAGLDASTLCEAFQRTAAQRGDQTALRTRGEAVRITWSEYAERVERLAAGLAGLGLRRGETLALMLTNRPEFNLLDSAGMHLGATCFSVYNTSAPEQIDHVVGDAGARVIVTERAFLDRVLEARSRLPLVEHVVVVDGEGEPETLSLAALEALADPGFAFEAAWRAIDPEDTLTLIYTSGTTGPPKGVELTHANLMAEWQALHEVARVSPGGRTISFLPAAHIGDRGLVHYGALVYGTAITCCPDPREVIAHLPDARPTQFGAVPRVWEKLKAGLEAAIAADPDSERRDATTAAIEIGRRRVAAQQAREPFPSELHAEWERADAHVLSKLREQLGLDEVEWLVAGAAPTPPDVIEFFAALGLSICELWGMSETSAVATINPPEAVRIGTVGPALPGVEVELARDGEVLVRGDVVMAGYRNQAERTAEAIDPQGWLHTGDIGELDEDGYLRIVDRKKELIINSAGKNMSPANIEAKLKEASPLIGQAVCIGDRRPYNTALLVLDPDGAGAFAAEHGLVDSSPGALAGDAGLVTALSQAVERANDRLSRVEQIKRFRVLGTDWEPGGDELTPTMKLKRKPIAEKYSAEIESLYG